MIIPNDYEIPAPEPGERPVSVKKASQLRAVMEAQEVVA